MAPRFDLSGLEGRVFDAVIVDNDMTLVDSDEGIQAAWTEWVIASGADPTALQGMTGMSTVGIIAIIVADENERPAAVKMIDDLELVHADTTKPLPGSARLLESLPDHRIAVASSGTHGIIAARMGAAGLTPPSTVVGAEDVAHAKPAPDIFLVACEKLGFAPERCLVIEDSLNGLEAAHAAGCAALAVTTTHTVDEVTPLADGVIGTLGDVVWHVTDDGISVALA